MTLNKMQAVFTTIRKNYWIDGGNSRYADYYNNIEALNLAKEEGELLWDFDKKVDDLIFPVITFNEAGVEGGQVFDTTNSREEIMRAASEYFLLDKSSQHTWYFEGYDVEEDYDTLVFYDENYESFDEIVLDVGNYDELIDDLMSGADPVEDGWENGVGEVISL